MDKNVKNPKVTVLMPVYNAEKFLKEAIDSILNQTFSNFEFIIINDASTDNSKKIIMLYEDKRIKYFENKKNLGVYKTLNKGLRIAKGTYIARMDADDTSYAQRLEMEYDKIVKSDHAAVIASFYEAIDINGKHLYAIKNASSAEEIYYALQFRNCLGHPTVMFNREVILDEFNGYQNYEAEDYELWIRISKKYKILKVKNILHKLRISDINRMTQFKGKIIKSAVKIAQKNLQLLIGKPIGSDIISILAGINPLGYSPLKIKQALSILDEINAGMLRKFPVFLDKSMMKKCCDNKKNVLRMYLFIAILFDSKLGFIFKTIYKLYRLTK